MLYNSERIENVGLIAVPEKQFQSCFSKKMTDIATCLEIVLVWQERSKATCMKITKCNRYILTHPELLHQILSNRKKEEEAIKEKCYSMSQDEELQIKVPKISRQINFGLLFCVL